VWQERRLSVPNVGPGKDMDIRETVERLYSEYAQGHLEAKDR
jgi:hypothetical protein